ncbi:DegT/DnrJ/EryC1/StrS family aminotransferase [Saccharopolyspora shandongensis]|uniref:DegT/DnrJ/EryC1/StrS family aminotransferase n=1 Tax=Saccharopolyspora shandongensis TaxID=418495 RepID=UPI0033C03679
MTDAITSVPIAAPIIGAEELEAVRRVLESGVLTQGPETAAFETEFSQYVDGRPCVAVNSGTSALLLALHAMDIGPGDEVIVPAFSFVATANAVRLAGAEPVFVDIEPQHLCIDPQSFAAAIGPRTAAVIPVHLYGHPAEIDEVMTIADRHGLAVLEDAAQAHLASWRARPVGTFGTAAAFSFYPTKNMTTGEGGMVTCADEDLARRVRLLRNQGMLERYVYETVGYNARMSELSAAIGRVQIRKLPHWTRARRRNAAELSAGFTQAGVTSLVALPRVSEHAEPVWHQYTVQVDNRDEIQARASAAGVGTSVHYPTPLHRLPPYQVGRDAQGCRPVAEWASRGVLSLPVHPGLRTPDISRIVKKVCEAVAG